MNRFLIFFIVVFLSCNDQTLSIENKMTVDEQRYNIVNPDPQFKERVIKLWETDYESADYEKYVEILDTLLQKAYLNTADAIASKVETKGVAPEKLTGFYESMGSICKYTSKPDSAIYYFRYVYLAYPIVPEYVGHNQLHFYNDAVMTWIEAEKCKESKVYFDSLMTVVAKFPDSLFYIGGEIRLDDFRKHIDTICKE